MVRSWSVWMMWPPPIWRRRNQQPNFRRSAAKLPEASARIYSRPSRSICRSGQRSTSIKPRENQIVYTRIAADLDTPVSLMLKLTDAGTNAFMLESVTGGEVRGRYSIIGMNPDLIWECRGTNSRVNRNARFDEAFEDMDGNPLDALRALLAESKINLPIDLPAASAGLFGYLGYDMIRLVEHLPNINPDPLGVPDAVMLRPSVVAVLDGVKGDVILVAPAWAKTPHRLPSRNPTSAIKGISMQLTRPKNISVLATSFRSSHRNAGHKIFVNRPLRCIAVCGARRCDPGRG